jgi:nucleoside 2-deoxyribosyltransferase
MIRAYVASPLAAVLRARHVARTLAEAGVIVCSQWHEIVRDGDMDPGQPLERARLLYANLCDLATADVLVLDTSEGMPRTTLVELGYALGRNLPAVWIQGPAAMTCLADAHALVKVVPNVEGAVAAIVGKRRVA